MFAAGGLLFNVAGLRRDAFAFSLVVLRQYGLQPSDLSAQAGCLDRGCRSGKELLARRRFVFQGQRWWGTAPRTRKGALPCLRGRASLVRAGRGSAWQRQSWTRCVVHLQVQGGHALSTTDRIQKEPPIFAWACVLHRLWAKDAAVFFRRAAPQLLFHLCQATGSVTRAITRLLVAERVAVDRFVVFLQLLWVPVDVWAFLETDAAIHEVLEKLLEGSHMRHPLLACDHKVRLMQHRNGCDVSCCRLAWALQAELEPQASQHDHVALQCFGFVEEAIPLPLGQEVFRRFHLLLARTERANLAQQVVEHGPEVGPLVVGEGGLCNRSQ